jgi:hypothetical protein
MQLNQDLRICPTSPPTLGERNLVPPKLGGLGGLIGGYCVSPEFNVSSMNSSLLSPL